MTTAATSPNVQQYRVVIAMPESRRVLALRTTDGYHLPRVSVPRQTRPAQQLRNAIRTKWNIEVLILELVMTDRGSPAYVIAELLSSPSNCDLTAISLYRISDSDLPERERSTVEDFLDGDVAGPFSRFGWLDKALHWIETATGRRISSKADIEQLNAGAAYSLVRFHTDDGTDYWMKATGEPNAHELLTTSLLSQISPAYLPELIAIKPEWNAWLMAGCGSPIPELPRDPFALIDLLGDAVESMAELQLKTIGQERTLLRSGAFDQRPDVLLAHSDTLFTYLDQCMQAQTSTKAARLESKRLHELRRIFEKACMRLSILDLPNTVIHGDMSLANILRGNTHCQFIDWCETYIGNPLITLEHLLLLNPITDFDRKRFVDRALRGRYGDVMSKVCDPAAMDAASIYMPLVAAVSALYGRGDWLGTERCEQPNRKVFARTIARHMDRAARSPTLQGALGI